MTEHTSTILIVDDEPTGRETLEALLYGRGYQLAFASNGREALEQAATLTPDLILLDVMMPGMDGFEVCRRLRADPLLREVPVIILTALDDQDSRMRGIEAGADDFASKPFNRAELRARVRTITRLNRYRRLLGERTKFEQVFEHAPVGIAIVDCHGTIILANSVMLRLLRAEQAEHVVGKAIHTFMVPDQVDHYAAAVDDVFANVIHVTQLETVFVRLNGEPFPATVDIGQFVWDDQPAAQIIVRDNSERKEAEERIRREAARTAALVRVASHLNAQLDLDMILKAVCTETTDALNVPIAMVSLFDPRQAMLYHAADVGLPPDLGEHLQPSLHAFHDAATQQRDPVIVVPDVQAVSDPPNAARYPELDIRTLVGARMLRQGEFIGRLTIATRHEVRHFSDDELALLHGLANLAAQAIANARLYAQAEWRLEQLQALRAIDMAITASLDLRLTLHVFLEQVITQLHGDAANILLLNPHTLMLEYTVGRGFHTLASQRNPLRLGEGFAGRAALERRTLTIPNLADTDTVGPLLPLEAFVTYHAAPLIAKGQVKGVLEIFHRTPFQPDPEWQDFLEAMAGQAAIAIDNAALFNELQHSNVELALAYDTTLEGWSHALDLRDKETEGHSQRVTDMTILVTRHMGMSEAELVHVRRGALLHDIGKMGIPDAILLKPGPLTEEEWVIMRKHPVYAYELLSPIPFLRPALDIPYCHHEKWDGTGYPRGIKSEQIPLSARIFAIVDVWDALRSDRPYRVAWPEERVRAHIAALAGSHFDPKAVEVFLRMEG